MEEQNKELLKTAAKKKPNLRYQRDKDREKVKGIFKFYEIPNGELSFVYKKYKEDDVETYTLVDGNIYTLPLGVAKHLNTSGSYPVHEYLKDASGKSVVKVGQKVRRYGFQSLEFVDIDELSSEIDPIITVENV